MRAAYTSPKSHKITILTKYNYFANCSPALSLAGIYRQDSTN
jgi:hypothetical protein